VLGSLSLAADISVEAGEGDDIFVCNDVVQVPAAHISATVKGREMGKAALLGGVNLHASDCGGDLEGVLEVHAKVGAARFGCCKNGKRG
jgi:hypothetical protein